VIDPTDRATAQDLLTFAFVGGTGSSGSSGSSGSHVQAPSVSAQQDASAGV
jgi:hypothetical protein